MNALKDYRLKNDLTQTQMCELIKPIVPQITIPLLSHIENGVVNPPTVLVEWLNAQGYTATAALTPMEMLVLGELQTRSSGHPLKRKELKELTKHPDQFNREIIGKLRDKGERVIGSPLGGYYIADNEEYAAWRKFYMSYINKMLRRISAMDKHTDGQTEIGALFKGE